MNIFDLLDEYLEHSFITKEQTTYKGELTLVRSLKRCFLSLGIEEVEDIEYEIYDKIVRYYKLETKCKNSSINKHTAYLKAVLRFFGFMTNTFLLAKKLKDDTRHTTVIDEDKLESILKFMYYRNSSINSIVHKTAVFLMYDTGCRIGELLNIEIQNIDFSERRILLTQTKSKKERFVFFTKLSEDLIKQLFLVNPQHKWLFWNLIENRRFNRDNDMRYVLKMIKRNLGYYKLHNHQFRKTMATTLSRHGAKTKTIQTILGHQSEKTTEIYIEYGSLEAQKEYEKFFKKESKN